MQFSVAAVAAFSALAQAAPAVFSLPNGFPYHNAASLAGIEAQAGGTLPNGPLPTSLEADAITDLKVIAVNEIFETAYFTSLLYNLTEGVSGYQASDLNGMSMDYVVDVIRAIRAQEELHATGANAILMSAGAQAITPCEYQFPVDNFSDAIALAKTFTDLVVGTLQAVQQTFALDGGAAASGLVPLIGSIIGQESEQIGYYRSYAQKIPSAAPFLTGGNGVYAFNAVAQMFIVPGSCGPDVAAIGIPSLATLATTSMPGPTDQTITFTTSATGVSEANHITYISGQNLPVVVAISNIATQDGMTTFQADFPFQSGFADGLTIAGLTKSAGPYTSAAEVASDSIAGPGLIEVN